MLNIRAMLRLRSLTFASCCALIAAMAAVSPAHGAGPLFPVQVAKRALVVRSLMAGKKVNLRQRTGDRLARKIAKALPLEAEHYKRAVVGQKFVMAERRDGVLEVYPRSLIANMLKTGQKGTDLGKRQVGTVARGRPIFAENGPEGTTALYRQLPASATGGIASTDINTSFALRKDDAMHPFGPKGLTVRFVLPTKLFQDAVEGRAGAVGWNNLGDGYSYGIDVAEEVQIPSEKVRAVAP